jgi:hypothetical protein
MKAIFLTVILALGGCAVPVVRIQDSEASRYAIVEVNLEAWLGDNSKGEFAYVGHIDGIWEDRFPNKKAGRLTPDGPLVKYVLIEPGVHDLTLVYNRNSLGAGGRKIWSGGVTEKAVLEPGRYFVRYLVDGDFVTLWLEDAKGKSVTEKRRSVIADASPTPPTAIPIIIPK